GLVGEWKVDFKKSGKYTLDLQARRFDSPLCGVVTVLDAAGKELARGEAADPAQDPSLAFQPPADGVYAVRIAERFRGRGGPGFAYRLRITDGPAAAAPGFRLTIPSDAPRGADAPSPD